MNPTPIAMYAASAIVCLMCAACSSSQHAPSQPFEQFVHRDGDTLKEGNQEFRFISFNIPNLHYVEDDMRFDNPMPFRLPDDFEISDALQTIQQTGGQVVRMYTLSVKKPDDPANMPRHILAPGQFNEEAFVALDRVVAAANRHHVRLIIPFVDQWSWFGGTAELAGFRYQRPEDFWTDPQVIADYKNIVSHVINRVNTITGVRYRDDKAILAWETGNELKATDAWTKEVAAHIKSLDPNHLVLDGAQRQTVSAASLDDPNVDFVQTHHYEKDPRDMIGTIVRNAKLAKGKKPYFVGEFGFLGTEAMCAVMDAAIDQKITGALLWSMRCRTREGGFYWHHEPYGGDRFKAYHWPGSIEIGENYDERRLMRFVREKAYAIRGLAAPALPSPAAPRLLTVTEGAQLTWQGSVGAADYTIERAEASNGPWTTIGTGASESQVQYRPLFADELVLPGKAYFYRVIARNASGASSPSNVVGPVRITHRTLVDEMWNDCRWFLKTGKLQFRENDARKFKEDCHRLSGDPNSSIVYNTHAGIRAVRVFVFSKSEDPGIRIWFSKDCRDFEPVDSEVARSSTYGEATYGYYKTLICTAKPAAADAGYVKIEFLSESQISRVEIEHGHVD